MGTAQGQSSARGGFVQHNLKGKPHKKGFRKFVIYRNSPLPTVEERLVFILSYLKLNPLQEQHADTSFYWTSVILFF